MSGRVYAALFDAFLWPLERLFFARMRRELLAAARGRVLEIGAGTGANLSYYSPDIRLVFSEPDAAMLRRARLDATPAVLASAEQLAFADRVFDTVVSTLVLCTVADPARALAEIRRVLKPGGSLLLLEHVRSSDAATARLQSRLTPAWGKLIRGCHLDRDTLATVTAAGFRTESVRRLQLTRILPFMLVQALAPLP